jgi:bacterioferritin-associated ferredoxin
MAALALPLPEPTGPGSDRACGRAMTRCECAGVSFEEVAARVRRGLSAAEALRGTGCGQTCTACVTDLARFLASS